MSPGKDGRNEDQSFVCRTRCIRTDGNLVHDLFNERWSRTKQSV